MPTGRLPQRVASSPKAALQEEQFWSGRLSSLKNYKQPQPSSGPPPLYIPAYVPPSIDARAGGSTPQPQALPTLHAQHQSQAASGPAPALAAAPPPPDPVAPPQPATLSGALVPVAAPSCCPSDSLVQLAQVEALKLQVSQLRRTNAELQQQLAVAAAERAAAVRQAAVLQLAHLQLPSGEPQQGQQAGPPSMRGLERDSLAAELQAELGLRLQPGVDAVPVALLQQLHASFQRRLADLQEHHQQQLQRQQEQHERELAQRQAEHEQVVQRQTQRHEREVRMLAEGLEDPGREAELRLLRDDCAYLKDKMRQLGTEYRSRVEVAAAEAKLSAQRQAAAEQRQQEQAAAEQSAQLEQLLAEAREAAAAGEAAAADAAALERAQHAAELARLQEWQAEELRRLKAEFGASLAQREQEYCELLEELRSLQAAMASAPPSRAGTRDEPQLQMLPQLLQPNAALAPAAGPPAASAPCSAGLAAAVQQQQQSFGAAPGQLMELQSDDDDVVENGGRQQSHCRPQQRHTHHQHSWQHAAPADSGSLGGGWRIAATRGVAEVAAAEWAEQPRQTPELLQHLRAAQALLQPAQPGRRGQAAASRV